MCQTIPFLQVRPEPARTGSSRRCGRQAGGDLTGLRTSSYVVWVTVPLPVLFVFLMVLRGLTLENSDAGIRMYLLGEGFSDDPYTWQDKILNRTVWTEACA